MADDPLPADSSVEISDAELAALALAAGGPDDAEHDVFGDDAVPYGWGDAGAALLPAWYMPNTLHGGGAAPRRRAVIVAGVVIAMLLVNAVGLCVTYGIPEVGDRISRLW